MSTNSVPLLRTPLHDLHHALGAKFVPFAGYEMPVQYASGVMAEHLHTRKAAGLFDVSHMGQLTLTGGNAAKALERLVPADILSLPFGRIRYTQFTTSSGGILDDLMVTNFGNHLYLVVNAANKIADESHLRQMLGADIEIAAMPERALLALQGPEAALVLSRFVMDIATLPFMASLHVKLDDAYCIISRCGYTGEDGFEISVPAEHASDIAQMLLAEPEVAPIGLGARDSLRLEAGLCLHGHDIGLETTPVEADLRWSIAKRRRQEGGFIGADIIIEQLQNGPDRRRVGIAPEGRAPAREGTEIFFEGRLVGVVTSGGFGPSLNAPVAMGYVEAAFAEAGTMVDLLVRGTPRPAKITRLPFIQNRYFRG